MRREADKDSLRRIERPSRVNHNRQRAFPERAALARQRLTALGGHTHAQHAVMTAIATAARRQVRLRATLQPKERRDGGQNEQQQQRYG